MNNATKREGEGEGERRRRKPFRATIVSKLLVFRAAHSLVGVGGGCGWRVGEGKGEERKDFLPSFPLSCLPLYQNHALAQTLFVGNCYESKQLARQAERKSYRKRSRGRNGLLQFF